MSEIISKRFCMSAAWSLAMLWAVAVPAQLPPQDPGETIIHPCYRVGSYTWDNGSGTGPVSGLVTWPMVCGDSHQRPPGVHDLVVIVHGDGFAYEDHEDLAIHLARNGYVVAIVGAGQFHNRDRTEKVLTFLDLLPGAWTHRSHLSRRLALVGHSRGGEAVLTTARTLHETPTVWSVEAVVSLAPTDSNKWGGSSRESLRGTYSPSFLVLYGSEDDDVVGACLGSDNPMSTRCPTPVPLLNGTGFNLYDRAGHENSSEGILNDPGGLTKAMVFVDNFDHGAWTDRGSSRERSATRSFVTAFLRWRLDGETALKRYFTGEWRPTAEAELRRQYAERSRRRVVDNFEQPGPATGSLGPVTWSSGFSLLREGFLPEHGDHSAAHQTRGLALAWSRPGPAVLSPWIQWHIPNQSTDGGIRLRDVSSFSHLSIRAGLMHGAPKNADKGSRSFSVRLRDAHGNSSARVSSALFDELAYPDEATVQILNEQGNWEALYAPKSNMQTVRFPLNYFYGLDLDHISDVQLYFDDERLEGELLLDSLEFVSRGLLGAGRVPADLPVGPLSLEPGERLDYHFQPDEDTVAVTVRLTGGSGDADLYVRRGDVPSLGVYDCRPFLVGNDELCRIEGVAGEAIHIMLDPYRAFYGAVLEITAENTPCTACEHEPGLMWNTGDVAYHPGGSYYYAQAGEHEAWLNGYPEADFDLYLDRWNGWNWTVVASSLSTDSFEHVAYQGTAGYYRWRVYSYQGSGRYDLYFLRP